MIPRRATPRHNPPSAARCVACGIKGSAAELACGRLPPGAKRQRLLPDGSLSTGEGGVEASTIDDMPEAAAEVVMAPAAADGAGEKRGRKRERGTTVPPWAPEEEARLHALIEELGEKDWTSVALPLP